MNRATDEIIAGVDVHYLDSAHVADEFKVLVRRSKPDD